MTKDEALRLALEALERIIATCLDPYSHEQVRSRPEHFINQAITAIKAALEAKDEPVACADNGVVNWIADKQFMHEAELYIAPPQRTWVGLTDKERREVWDSCERQTPTTYVKAIEAKLKEKNT